MQVVTYSVLPGVTSAVSFLYVCSFLRCVLFRRLIRVFARSSGVGNAAGRVLGLILCVSRAGRAKDLRFRACVRVAVFNLLTAYGQARSSRTRGTVLVDVLGRMLARWYRVFKDHFRVRASFFSDGCASSCSFGRRDGVEVSDSSSCLLVSK